MTWKDELCKIPAPEPSQDLLERILASRAAGVRVALPTTTARASARWRLGALVAAAAALVLWVGVRSPVSREGNGALERHLLWEMPFSPAEALGQEMVAQPSAPRYPLVSDVRGSRVQAGSWHYTSCTTTDDVLTKCGGRISITISEGAWNRKPVWIMSQSLESVRDWTATKDTLRSPPDTIYFARTGLRPVRLQFRSTRVSLVQDFERDSVREAFDYTGPRARSWQVSAALPDPPEAPLVVWRSEASVTLLLQALPLKRGWRGSAYSVGLIGAAARIPPFVALDFRVVGNGRVDVPAGRFECWKVEVHDRWDQNPLILWVSKDHGWLIQTTRRGSDWRNETFLTAYEAPTPPAP